MIDITNLTEKLNSLSGLDFEECEAEERKIGNNSIDITFSKSFQARLAARALGCNPHDIKNLPLRKYSKVVTGVLTFLFSDSEADETQTENSEK